MAAAIVGMVAGDMVLDASAETEFTEFSLLSLETGEAAGREARELPGLAMPKSRRCRARLALLLAALVFLLAAAALWPSAYIYMLRRGYVMAAAVAEDYSCGDDNKTEKLILVNSLYPIIVNGSVLQDCPATCRLSSDSHTLKDADAVVWNPRWMKPITTPPSPNSKKACQRWVFNFYYESAVYEGKEVKIRPTREFQAGIDWTMTYRVDSDFYQPYTRLGPLEIGPQAPKRALESGNATADRGVDLVTSANAIASSLPTRLPDPASKPQLLLWLVSNCIGARTQYFERLKGYLPQDRVHIYGKCGTQMPCPRLEKKVEDPDPCEEEFFGRFKFYAAFENSRCTGYITEKFARGLQFGMVPVVNGGRSRADYEAIAPADSFIHVDDFASTKALADHLLMLDRDDAAYSRMFAWRSKVYLWPRLKHHMQPFCDLCQELHKPRREQKASIGNKLVHWWYDNTCKTPIFPH